MTLRARVHRSDGTVPRGTLIVRLAGTRKILLLRALRRSSDGHRLLEVRGVDRGRHTFVVTYRDSRAPRVRDRVRVRITR